MAHHTDYTKVYGITYWDNKGKYQREYDKIFKMFFENQGKSNFKKTENKEINLKLKKLLFFSNRLYKFYNDGNAFQYKSQRIKFQEFSPNPALKEIEEEMDNLISDIWTFLIKEHPKEMILQGLEN